MEAARGFNSERGLAALEKRWAPHRSAIEERRDRVAKLKRQGLTNPQIAKAVGRSLPTVQSDLDARGVPRHRGRGRENVYGPDVECVCLNPGCANDPETRGPIFLTPAREVARGFGKYCSDRCKRKDRYRGKDTAKKKGEWRTCRRRGCDHRFWRYDSQIAVGQGVCCSYSCSLLLMWREKRISQKVIELFIWSVPSKRRWGGRWGGREKGGRPKGRLSSWNAKAPEELARARTNFEREHGRPPSYRELAALTGIPKSTIADLSGKPS